MKFDDDDGENGDDGDGDDDADGSYLKINISEFSERLINCITFGKVLLLLYGK